MNQSENHSHDVDDSSANRLWEHVPPADLSQLSPADFTDKYFFLERIYDTDPRENSNLHMPFYLAHFHRLANSVLEDTQDRGFITLPVWRGVDTNKPYNARIMENIVSLAYFYSNNEQWNVYYGSAAVKQRLEAALEFWIRSQSENGRFSEYAEKTYNLAATAFATKFMGETLRLLRSGPMIDLDLYERTAQADRKAIMATLTSDDLYAHGKRFSNQYGNVFPGALAYLSLFEDTEMKALLAQQMAAAENDFQSPAGYFYERDSADWKYNIGTHRNNTRAAWFYAKGTDLEPHFVRTELHWYDWLSYNAVPEPDGSAFILNRALESRQKMASFQRLDHEIAEYVPLARAFASTDREIRLQIDQQRRHMANSWPAVAELIVPAFFSYTPYTFVKVDLKAWSPSDVEQRNASAQLPYIRSSAFTHQRADSRKPLVLTYVKRPTYYAAFNAGEKAEQATGQQRFGLGLLWNAQAGTLLQSQTGTSDAAWGTMAAGEPLVYEAQSLHPVYEIEEEAIEPVAGTKDLPVGDTSIRYALGGSGQKNVAFTDDRIVVSIEHNGEFIEWLPLMVKPDDLLKVEPDRVVLTRDGVAMEIRINDDAAVSANRTVYNIEKYSVVSLMLSTKDRLKYEISIHIV